MSTNKLSKIMEKLEKDNDIFFSINASKKHNLIIFLFTYILYLVKDCLTLVIK